jgi:hypothetical protein
MPSLESLNDLLNQAAKVLDTAALQVRDVPLEPRKENIRRIAAVLTAISRCNSESTICVPI